MWDAARNGHCASAVEYIWRGARVIKEDEHYDSRTIYETSILDEILKHWCFGRRQVEPEGRGEFDDSMKTFEAILDCPAADHRLGDDVLHECMIFRSYEAFRSRRLTRKLAEGAVWKVGLDAIRRCFSNYLDFMRIVAHTCYFTTVRCNMWYEMSYSNRDKSICQLRESLIALDSHDITSYTPYLRNHTLNKCCVEDLFLIDLIIGFRYFLLKV